MTNKYDLTYIKIAETIAENSRDTRLKVGAVITSQDRNHVIAVAYNGGARGATNTNQDENGVTKDEVIHAEMNAIIQAARSTNSCVGGVMYLTHSPCQRCAAAVLQAGIIAVRFKEPYRDQTGVEYLKKYGVSVEQVRI